MSIVDTLVFSKDRACQLDLLLASIRRHAPGFYSSLTVLYTASSAEFLRGYGFCFVEHPEAVFVLEHDFEVQTRAWLAGFEQYQPLSFLVDDDVFVRTAPAGLERVPLSLRGGDYDYPFSVDGNVYYAYQLQGLLSLFSFNNPTELEAGGHERRDWLPFERVNPTLKPCLVGVPWNRVSLSSGMPFDGPSVRALNDWYLQDNRIDPARYDTARVHGVHEILEPPF